MTKRNYNLNRGNADKSRRSVGYTTGITYNLGEVKGQPVASFLRAKLGDSKIGRTAAFVQERGNGANKRKVKQVYKRTRTGFRRIGTITHTAGGFDIQMDRKNKKLSQQE